MRFSRLAVIGGSLSIAFTLVACQPGDTRGTQPTRSAQATSSPAREPATSAPAPIAVDYVVQLGCPSGSICGDVVAAAQVGNGCKFSLGDPMNGRIATITRTPCPPRLRAHYQVGSRAGGRDVLIRHLVPVRISKVANKATHDQPTSGCFVEGEHLDKFWKQFYAGTVHESPVDSTSECRKLKPGMVVAVPINWVANLGTGRTSAAPGSTV